MTDATGIACTACSAQVRLLLQLRALGSGVAVLAGDQSLLSHTLQPYLRAMNARALLDSMMEAVSIGRGSDQLDAALGARLLQQTGAFLGSELLRKPASGAAFDARAKALARELFVASAEERVHASRLRARRAASRPALEGLVSELVRAQQGVGASMLWARVNASTCSALWGAADDPLADKLLFVSCVRGVGVGSRRGAPGSRSTARAALRRAAQLGLAEHVRARRLWRGGARGARPAPPSPPAGARRSSAGAAAATAHPRWRARLPRSAARASSRTLSRGCRRRGRRAAPRNLPRRQLHRALPPAV